MASHKNFNSLKEKALWKAKVGMKTVIHEDVSTQMQMNVTREVYNKYNPLAYTERRKYGEGGLADENSITGKIEDSSNRNGFTYRFRNESKAYSKPHLYLTPLIVLGQVQSYIKGYPLWHDYITSHERMNSIQQPSDFTPYYEPRDFITPTREYVRQQSNQLTRQLERFMNR